MLVDNRTPSRVRPRSQSDRVAMQSYQQLAATDEGDELGFRGPPSPKKAQGKGACMRDIYGLVAS